MLATSLVAAPYLLIRSWLAPISKGAYALHSQVEKREALLMHEGSNERM